MSHPHSHPHLGGSEVSLLRSLTPVGVWMVGVGEMGGAAGQTGGRVRAEACERQETGRF